MTRLCFLDTETTGLDPRRHQVYEIGLIVVDDMFEQEWRWWLPVDLSGADSTALRIGHFYERLPDPFQTDDDAWEWTPNHSDAAAPMRVELVLNQFARLTAEAHLIGAVPSFDAAFLEPLLRRHGLAPAWHYHLVDCEALAAGWLAAGRDDHPEAASGFDKCEPPWDSNELSLAVGVDPTKFDRHTALGDARWAKAIYEAVIG